MPVSVGPTRQVGECTYQDDAELREGDHGLTEGVTTIRVLDIDDVCPAELEHLYQEDKLGCARGVLWALVFEAGVVIAALAYWKLHLFAR